MIFVLMIYYNLVLEQMLVARPVVTVRPPQTRGRPTKYPDRNGKVHPDSIKIAIERSCLRKKNFTEEQANQIVDRMAARRELIFYYKCKFCGSHHMTAEIKATHKNAVGVI